MSQSFTRLFSLSLGFLFFSGLLMTPSAFGSEKGEEGIPDDASTGTAGRLYKSINNQRTYRGSGR